MKSRYRVATIAAASTLALAACSSNADDPADTADNTAQPTANGESAAPNAPLLNLGMVDAPGQGGFSAADISFATKSPYGQAVYDTLLRALPDNQLEPSLATAWEYNDDGTVLRLTVRDDVTFTDGTEFNAEV